jgi:hypothetical protein
MTACSQKRLAIRQESYKLLVLVQSLVVLVVHLAATKLKKRLLSAAWVVGVIKF